MMVFCFYFLTYRLHQMACIYPFLTVCISSRGAVAARVSRGEDHPSSAYSRGIAPSVLQAARLPSSCYPSLERLPSTGGQAVCIESGRESSPVGDAVEGRIFRIQAERPSIARRSHSEHSTCSLPSASRDSREPPSGKPSARHSAEDPDFARGSHSAH